MASTVKGWSFTPASTRASSATASKVSTGNTRMSAPKARPCATAQAVRRPVKDPGPRPNTMASSWGKPMPACDSISMEMLSQAGIGLPQLDAIVFGRGPGSFTGLRTACAVAQGLAFGADILVLPVDTLLAVAEEARVLAGVNDQPLTVLAMLDARMDEVYSAAWDWDGQRWTLRQPLQVGGPQHVLLPDAPRVLLAGNAFEAYGERLPAGERVQALPTAAALLRLAPSWGKPMPACDSISMAVGIRVAEDWAPPARVRTSVWPFAATPIDKTSVLVSNASHCRGLIGRPPAPGVQSRVALPAPPAKCRPSPGPDLPADSSAWAHPAQPPHPGPTGRAPGP